ncbi:MAG: beta-galactosidase [Rhizobiaceae bacterium]|nr:beta-galactosidase [Hyphomicrobiales bacterium]NRB31861.1 beta-galactosidase [Rhizobiaceae bacterium]
MSKISPSLGVCYYPEHWSEDMWAEDARRMVTCGLKYVRIAEFAWSRFEPARDRFDFEWLDRAIEILGNAGLNVVMCTPSATPPKWLVEEMPDMVAIEANGNPRKWGSRRHYDFSHKGYRRECVRIAEILAKRYGENPFVAAWQIDNEYGCHDTTLSYSDAACIGFRDWLAQKYQSPDALNRAWGNVFWSMEVSDFNEVELPNLTVTEPNPSHVLDFRRYSSDQVVEFNRLQVDVLRRLAPGRDLIHNFMGKFLEFDHFDVGADLDVASWDSYPLGNLERFGRDDAWKNWYLRAGDPDFQAFHHDLYRGCGQGRMWVMEQQPGPVNWAPWNPAPHKGMVRLWSHEAFAHGAEVVSYFRWRQAPFAQEQFHAALNRPDGSADLAYEEAQQVAGELKKLGDGAADLESRQSRVALVFDYPSQWATEIQPQGEDYDGFRIALDWYGELRRAGQNIDIVAPSSDFDGYDLVVVPHLLMLDDDFVARARNSGARFLFGPRSGSRTPAHQIPANLAPGQLQDLVNLKVLRTESLRSGIVEPVEEQGAFLRWFEHVEADTTADVQLRTSSGTPAYVAAQKASYIAGWPNEQLLKHVVQTELKNAGLAILETGEDLRIRDRGNLRTIVNYAHKQRDASHLIGSGDEIVVGEATLEPGGVTILRRG